jgi:hypothetical protein
VVLLPAAVEHERDADGQCDGDDDRQGGHRSSFPVWGKLHASMIRIAPRYW